MTRRTSKDPAMNAALEPLELVPIDGPANSPATYPVEAASQGTALTPARMLEIAVERGADLDQLQRFMDLNDRYQAAQAKKAYDAAFARFKANAPKLVKNKLVDFTTKSGARTTYMHATLDNVVGAAVPLLAAQGLTHRWKTTQADGRITVTCTLTHVDGHSEHETLTAQPDDSGNKNSIQAVISARTYLERHTFLGITGLAAGDAEDDDGQGAGPARKEPPKAPADYENWKADMVALADEGIKALQDCWARTAPDLRQYATEVDADWLASVKELARKVPS